MPFKDRLDRLGAIAARLPFPLADFQAVDETFCRWAKHHEDRDLETLEIWLYCYVQRYVLARLMRFDPLGAGEADRIIEKVFERAHEFGKVSEPEHFTRWVSVVCRNTFINSLRRRYQPNELEDAHLAGAVENAEPDLSELDRAHLRYVLDQAIGRLPPSIQPVARMRLLERRSYEHIADTTGHKLATVRTYAAKAVQRLRDDPGLRALGHAFNLAPP